MNVMLSGKGELKSQMELRLLTNWIWTREINMDYLDGSDINSPKNGKEWVNVRRTQSHFAGFEDGGKGREPRSMGSF